MGGDEFVLVLPSSAPSVVEQRALAIRQTIGDIGDEVSISIGAAFFPGDGTTAEQLMVAADARMFEEKRVWGSVPQPEASLATGD
jgi:GGDEF domain-containing protein